MPESNRAPWVDGLTISAVLRRTATAQPDQLALAFPTLDKQWTYQEFLAEVEAAARGLLALGIQTGEHVAVWGTNVPQWVILQFATAQIGAVLVTVNPAYRPFELRYCLKQSDAKALFLIDRFKSSDYHAMFHEVCPELSDLTGQKLACAEFPRLNYVVSLRGTPSPGMHTWEQMLAAGSKLAPEAIVQAAERVRPEDPINIQYTSGTTGFPKAATLSARNLLLNAYHVGQRQRITSADRICIPVPFYHCFGCVMGTLCAVVHGAGMIIPEESFSPVATLDAIERYRATVIYGVPTMFIAQLNDPSFAGRDLSSLRTGIMAGSPCPIEIMRRVVREMGAEEITIAYGQTEASPVITQTAAEDPLEVRVETVGRPLPDVEVKVIHPESGLELADNEQGELCARGPNVMLGYYRDPVATAEAIDPQGWLHTGDLAVRRPDGNYRITGRIKDMVIRGGENIYPREIEEYLFTHPDVEQATVVGVPDPKFVEELCAWVKPKPGVKLDEEQLRTFCRQGLAHYKVPRYVRIVQEFPQTVTGKIQKFKIREAMISELKLAEQDTA